MAATITFAAHPTRVTNDAWCAACCAPVATEVDISLVTDDLRVFARMRGTSCDCGYEDHTRLT